MKAAAQEPPRPLWRRQGAGGGDHAKHRRLPRRAIQGEAGVIIPLPGYFARVRELFTAHDVMLILDEIQTELGRTGKLLAEQHDGIEADVTLLGKALPGGFYPVSAVLSNNAVLGTLKPGQHGSTFGGNPLACAVARAALRVLVEVGMIEKAAVQGEPWTHDPHCSTACDNQRPGRLGAGEDRSYVQAVLAN